MTQREVALVFGQTPANISHYEAGKQEFPPECARALIAEAQRLGVDLTFDEIYDVPGRAMDQLAPAPLQEPA